MSYLFAKDRWHNFAQQCRERVAHEVESLDTNRFLNTDPAALADYLEQKYRLDVPVLREAEAEVDWREAKVDVSHMPQYRPRMDGRPNIIPGTEIELCIPFDGWAEAFFITPTSTTGKAPSGFVKDGVLSLRIAGGTLTQTQVKAALEQNLAEVKQYLGWLGSDAERFNAAIRKLAEDSINYRRTKLFAARTLASSLGFPLKERDEGARAVLAPAVRRKLAPSLPPASAKPQEQDPELLMKDYEHILGVMQNLVLVMERSPKAFKALEEEALRYHILVQLNGWYEGQATGETFNYEGKTDILIRVNGRTIFIAECKFWTGPKGLIDTIDQILSYASWRDTKVAIIVFNRNKDFSKVLAAIPDTVRHHPNFKRYAGAQSETTFRFAFTHRDDANREMLLTVLAFDVPT